MLRLNLFVQAVVAEPFATASAHAKPTFKETHAHLKSRAYVAAKHNENQCGYAHPDEPVAVCVDEADERVHTIIYVAYGRGQFM